MNRFIDILIFSTFIALSHGKIFDSLYRKTPCETLIGKAGDQFEAIGERFIDKVTDQVRTQNIKMMSSDEVLGPRCCPHQSLIRLLLFRNTIRLLFSKPSRKRTEES